MGINQRVSLRRFADDIRGWVGEGRSDGWIASALGTTPSSVQSFRSRNAIYRTHAPGPAPATLPETISDPADYTAYEGVVETGEVAGIWFDPAIMEDPRWGSFWSGSPRVELHLLPEKIILVRPRV
jgi:hypothetical protein